MTDVGDEDPGDGAGDRGLEVPDQPSTAPEPGKAALHNPALGHDLEALWQKYRAVHPADGCGYSRVCELYRGWEGRLSPTMRQQHFSGERAFVYYAGGTLKVIDGASGKVRQAQVFVGALGGTGRFDSEPIDVAKLPLYARVDLKNWGKSSKINER